MLTSGFNIDADEIQYKLGRVFDRLKDLQPALSDVAKMQMGELDSQYATEGSNILGNKWTKRTKNYSWPILNKTGKMKGNHQISELTKNKLSIANETPYFKYHQTGTSIMPQRQVHGHSDKMAKAALDIVADFILKNL